MGVVETLLASEELVHFHRNVSGTFANLVDSSFLRSNDVFVLHMVGEIGLLGFS